MERSSRLGRWIIVLAMVAVVVGVILAAALLRRQAEERAVAEFLSRQEIVTRQAAEQLTRFIAQRQRGLELVQEQLFWQTALLPGRLRQVYNQYDGFHTLLYIDANGYFRFGYPIDLYRGSQVSGFPVLSEDFASVAKSGRGLVSRERLREGEKLLLPIVAPIVFGQDFQGAVVGLLDASALGRLSLLPMTFGKEGIGILYEPGFGTVYQASPTSGLVPSRDGGTVYFPPALEREAAVGKSGTGIVPWPTVPSAFSYSPVKVNRVPKGVVVFGVPISGEVGSSLESYSNIAVFLAEEINRKVSVPVDLDTPDRIAGKLGDFWKAIPQGIEVTVMKAAGNGSFVVLATNGPDKVGQTVTADDFPSLSTYPEATLTQLVTTAARVGRAPQSIQTAVPILVTDSLLSVVVATPLPNILGTLRGWMNRAWTLAGGAILVILVTGLLLLRGEDRRSRERLENMRERLRLEEEIIRAKNQLQGIFDGIGAGILLMGEGGRILRANNAFAAWTEKAPGELLGRPFASVFPSEAATTLGSMLAESSPAGPRILPWHHGRMLEASSYPVPEANGESRQHIVTLHDVTERLRVQERLGVAEKLAATSGLVAGVAHEIKNPLNSMSLSLGNLSFILKRIEQRSDREKGEEYVARLRDDIRRLALLVNRFMEVARPVPEERRELDLSELVDRIAGRFAEQAHRSGIEVSLDLQRVPRLLLEPAETERAVENLVLNAIEAMPAGGVLSLRTSAVEHGVTVEVGDTGPGIPPEIAGKIFDIFFTTKEGGTGLGLSIAYRAVEGQGGRITVESDPGRGSRFRIVFPDAN